MISFERVHKRYPNGRELGEFVAERVAGRRQEAVA